MKLSFFSFTFNRVKVSFEYYCYDLRMYLFLINFLENRAELSTLDIMKAEEKKIENRKLI